jgi:D-alanyl-D-alanine carboxypeptidase (penicillin-binding protein 5/6)
MRRGKLIFLTLLIIVGGLAYWLYQRPLPAVQAEVIIPQPPVSQSIQLPWPQYGQAAIGAVGYGVLQQNHADKPVPIASIAKTITALAILKEKPLAVGEQGPAISLTAADVKLYQDYLAQDGSVFPVAAGSQISEYQALQAMMLPSANNVADTTAAWAFVSVNNYVDYANQFVKQLGMMNTTVAVDASGFSPKTVSTAKDLVLLGEAALQNPVLAEIVNQKEASFPAIGSVPNVNWLLGTDGILGIKTGNTDEAGGCYLFGAKRSIANGPEIRLIGAVLGAPNRNKAMADSQLLIQAADKGFEPVTAVATNQTVGRYKLPWGGSVDAVAASEMKVIIWKGKVVALDTDLAALKVPKEAEASVGSIRAISGSTKKVTVELNQPAPEPSWRWRIFR